MAPNHPAPEIQTNKAVQVLELMFNRGLHHIQLLPLDKTKRNGDHVHAISLTLHTTNRLEYSLCLMRSKTEYALSNAHRKAIMCYPECPNRRQSLQTAEGKDSYFCTQALHYEQLYYNHLYHQ